MADQNFEDWFRTFIEEKDLPEVMFEITYKGYTHFIDNYEVVEVIVKLEKRTQAKIKDQLVKIDLFNGDVNNFLEYVAKGYVELVVHEELEDQNLLH